MTKTKIPDPKQIMTDLYEDKYADKKFTLEKRKGYHFASLEYLMGHTFVACIINIDLDRPREKQQAFVAITIPADSSVERIRKSFYDAVSILEKNLKAAA